MWSSLEYIIPHNFFNLHSYTQTMAPTLYFLNSFLLKLDILFFFALIYLINCVQELLIISPRLYILGFLKISFVKKIRPECINFASGRFLGQRQKATTFFAKTKKRIVSNSVAIIVPLWNILSLDFTVHIDLRAAVICELVRKAH